METALLFGKDAVALKIVLSAEIAVRIIKRLVCVSPGVAFIYLHV